MTAASNCHGPQDHAQQIATSRVTGGLYMGFNASAMRCKDPSLANMHFRCALPERTETGVRYSQSPLVDE